MNLKKIFDLLALIVVVLFFASGVYILKSPQFGHLPQTTRVIFSIILFLYGIYRLAKIFIRDKTEEE